MTVQKHVVRDVFVILLCATVIGLALSGIVHKAATVFNPFIPNDFSQTVNIFVSPRVVDNSSGGTTQSLPSVADNTSTGTPHLMVTDISSTDTSQPMVTDNSSRDSPQLSSNTTDIFSTGITFQNVAVPAPAPAPALDELDMVLAKTANSNKTVIITALNGAWAEPNTMIDLFLESFRIGEGTQELLNNLLIVALDEKSYKRCLQIHPHCYTLKTRGIDFSAEKVYMSQDYLKMMWRRLGFLGDILKRGYSFVFSDADIMWLRNPFTRFSTDADIQIASDRYNGNPFDVNNMPNGGYKYVRSNERTISFYRYWYLSRRLFPGQNEQDVLNIVKFTRGFGRRGLNFMFLDTKYFGGFCERSQYMDDVCTMHANCCKGLKAKIADLRQTLDDWSEYRNPHQESLNSTRKVGEWRPPTACQRSWDR